MMKRRVVITGMGAVSPCGLTLDETWQNLVAGKSGVDTITHFDASAYPSQIAGEVKGFDPEKWIEKKRIVEVARFIQISIAAAEEAVAQSGFKPDEALKDRTATIVGVGFCGLEVMEAQHKRLLERGPRRMSPYFIPATISNLAPGQLSMRFGLRGPSFTTTSACSSGAHAIGEAFRWISRGGADAAIAGGAEASVSCLGVGGFAAMRALSKRNDAPTEASRPFDKGRDGFVIAEGCGLFVLEEYEAAKKRGANILAEIAGYGTTADAHHLTQPAPEGKGAKRAMQLAMEDAQLNPEQIGYINAHGTSTPAGDVAELQAIEGAFGTHAKNGLLISSTKSMTGHLLGAAGGLEAVLATNTLLSGEVPPTINLTDPDPAAQGFDLVANEARKASVDAVLSNSFGFGGTNVSLIIKRPT